MCTEEALEAEENAAAQAGLRHEDAADGADMGERPAGCGMTPPNQTAFAAGLCFCKLFWIFFIGCFIGVAVETLWCLATRHRLESRAGVIYGPFNPVYGFGAVLLTLCLHQLRKRRDLWIFLCSMALGGAFEYLCSLVQELAFGTVSWEYSHTKFNVGGRTNLLYSFFWGVLGIIWVKDLYPFLSRLIEKIPKRPGVVLTWALCAFMVFNMGVSALASARQADRAKGIPADNAIARFLDAHYPDAFMYKVYPNAMPADNIPTPEESRKGGWRSSSSQPAGDQ